MANTQGTRIGTVDKVSILLHEYDTLRSEIVSRTGHGFQLLTVGAAVLAWLTAYPMGVHFWIWLVIAVTVFGMAIWFTLRDIGKAAERLREIEAKVDRETGEWYLLRWERLWSAAKTGFFRRATHLPVPPKPPAPTTPPSPASGSAEQRPPQDGNS